MKPSTLFFLLGLALVFAVFGLQVFGWLLAFAVGTVLLAVLAVVIGLWVIKRRMQARLWELGQAVEQRLRSSPDPAGRRDGAIDVEGVVRTPRDGADDPDELAQGGPAGPRN